MALGVAALVCANSVRADDVLWPSEVRRVDPGRQDYERLPPKEPAALPNAKPVGWFRVRGFVRITDSASFVYNKKAYKLAGADPIANSKICLDKNGGRWNCGLKARNVFKQYLTDREVSCVPIETTDLLTSVECGSDAFDVATEMIRLGFAVEP
jgi:endonuclease YncB( thermonuclease family)